jgi:hypothetical protein
VIGKPEDLPLINTDDTDQETEDLTGFTPGLNCVSFLES